MRIKKHYCKIPVKELKDWDGNLDILHTFGFVEEMKLTNWTPLVHGDYFVHTDNKIYKCLAVIHRFKEVPVKNIFGKVKYTAVTKNIYYICGERDTYD